MNFKKLQAMQAKLDEAEAQANDRSRSYQIASILADYFKERAK